MLKSSIFLVLTLLTVSMLGSCSKDLSLYRLFPDAAKIHVYGAPAAMEVRVDRAGQVRALAFTHMAVTDGGWLTATERAELRQAIRITHPPDGIAMCCFPRHTFLFYDATSHYLGHLDVCFECGCAQIFPLPPTNRQLNWINWNRQMVGQIVESHHLGPLKPPRP